MADRARGATSGAEDKREVHLSESLTETSSDLALESGAGFKTETYRTGRALRTGDIAEQSKLFGKVYAYTFDYAAIRSAIEALAQEHGYTVQYQLTVCRSGFKTGARRACRAL